MFYVRVAATGEVLGAAFSAPQDDAWIRRYLSALGLSPAVVLEFFEADSDPRLPGAMTEPVPEKPSMAPSRDTRIADALDAGDLRLAARVLRGEA